MMTSDDVKSFCKQQNLTYRELAAILGNSEASLHSAIAKGVLSTPMSRSIEMYKEILRLRDELKEYEVLKQALKKALS